MSDQEIIDLVIIEYLDYEGRPFNHHLSFVRAPMKEDGKPRALFTQVASIGQNGFWLTNGRTFVPAHRILGITVHLREDIEAAQERVKAP